MLGRSGIMGLLLVVAVLYFTNAGTWMWNNLKGLESSCYGAMSRVSMQFSGPVCGAVNKGVTTVEDLAQNLQAKLDMYRDRVFGTSSFGNFAELADAFGARVSRFASSSETLSQMVQSGPAQGRSGSGSFQQAIDNFTIGQNFLKMDGRTLDALPWLQQGAAQPQGYGVMSQIALGNLYMNGGNGVTANPQMASYYLSQAQNSIAALTGNGSPQSQQILQALPASPQQTQAELQRLIQQLKQIQR